jgi:serine/threonine protein kinase
MSWNVVVNLFEYFIDYFQGDDKKHIVGYMTLAFTATAFFGIVTTVLQGVFGLTKEKMDAVQGKHKSNGVILHLREKWLSERKKAIINDQMRVTAEETVSTLKKSLAEAAADAEMKLLAASRLQLESENVLRERHTNNLLETVQELRESFSKTLSLIQTECEEKMQSLQDQTDQILRSKNDNHLTTIALLMDSHEEDLRSAKADYEGKLKSLQDVSMTMCSVGRCELCSRWSNATEATMLVSPITGLHYTISYAPLAKSRQMIYSGTMLRVTDGGAKVIVKVFGPNSEAFQRENSFFDLVDEVCKTRPTFRDECHQYMVMRVESIAGIRFRGQEVSVIIYCQDSDVVLQDMNQWINGFKADPPKVIIMKRLAQCLQFLHEELRCCHLDIKPENVVMYLMLTKTGYEVIVKLIDFEGWCRIGEPIQSVDSRRLHSYRYTAPEVLEWILRDEESEVLRADPSMDVWSYGMVYMSLILRNEVRAPSSIADLIDKSYLDEVCSALTNADDRLFLTKLTFTRPQVRKQYPMSRLLEKRTFGGAKSVVTTVVADAKIEFLQTDKLFLTGYFAFFNCRLPLYYYVVDCLKEMINEAQVRSSREKCSEATAIYAINLERFNSLVGKGVIDTAVSYSNGFESEWSPSDGLDVYTVGSAFLSLSEGGKVQRTSYRFNDKSSDIQSALFLLHKVPYLKHRIQDLLESAKMKDIPTFWKMYPNVYNFRNDTMHFGSFPQKVISGCFAVLKKLIKVLPPRYFTGAFKKREYVLQCLKPDSVNFSLRSCLDDGTGEQFLHFLEEAPPSAEITKVSSLVRYALGPSEGGDREERREAIACDLDTDHSLISSPLVE